MGCSKPIAMANAGPLTLNGGLQVLPLASAQYDPLGWVNTSTNAIVVQKAGRYQAIVSFNTNPSGLLSTAIYVNSSVQRYGNYNITAVILEGVVILQLAVGDSVQGAVSGPNGQAILTGSDRSYLHLFYIG